MRKISFTSLLFGVVCAAACAAVPHVSWALEAPAVAQGPVNGKAIALHPHAVTRHARGKHPADKRAAAKLRAMRHQALALAKETTTQPDIAVPPPPPPPAAQPGEERKSANTANSAETRRVSESKLTAEAAAKSKVAEQAAVQAPPPREVRQFCANTAMAATDARIAWQAARLTDLAGKLRQRIAELEAKRAEYEDWLHRHDEAMKEAKEDIVAIYSRMRPDAAAAQLAAMDEVMAASLLTKLNSRVASAILAEMDPGRAARITNAMVGPINAAGGKKS